MVFITGDTHAEFNRFNITNFLEQKSMSKSDFVIICGDFGGVWDDSKKEQYWLDWLNDKPFTVLFVDGNHENFDLINNYPVKDWNGGKVHFIRDSIIHLMRGQVFTIDGKRFFTIGGASSHDINDGILEPADPDFKSKRKLLDKRNAMYRINHVSWWKEEMPSDDEYTEARKNLAACEWKVDYIVSHCCPINVANMLGMGIFNADRLTDFLQEVSERCEFRHWYFGHYHDNRVIMGKYSLLYEQIIAIQS